MQAKTKALRRGPGELRRLVAAHELSTFCPTGRKKFGQNSDLSTPFAAASIFGGFPMLPILAELAKFAQHARTTSVATDEGSTF